jgi:nucleoside-diphosphate-sugar epimerase
MLSNTKPRIVITGANGFIGSFLVEYLSRAGYPVLALVRSIPANQRENITYSQFDLNIGLADPGILNKDDILVHCAYSKLADAKHDANTSGLKLLLAAAEKTGIKKHLFFSSISAKPVTSSYYGRHKYQSTLLFNKNDAILTTGLVIGNGGVFAHTLAFIKKTGLIPTIQKGKQPIYFVGIHEAAEAVHKIISENLSGNFLLANPTPVSYIDFYKKAALFYQTRARRLHVPVSLMKLVIYLNSFLKKPFITQENLKGLTELTFIENTDQMCLNIVEFEELEQVFPKAIIP